jgi:hypothetical protein
MENKKFRMYGLVPYNLSPIQQGIQYGHALQEYNNWMFYLSDVIKNGVWETEEEAIKAINIYNNFKQWSKEDKTFILLNGGTTNKDIDSGFYGTMNQHLDWLEENDIAYETFYEPDLGNQLTAIVFLVEEQIWGTPSWEEYCKINLEDSEDYQFYRRLWTKLVGGDKNALFKEWLSQFKLA